MVTVYRQLDAIYILILTSEFDFAGHTLCVPLNVILDGLFYMFAESLSAIVGFHLDVW